MLHCKTCNKIFFKYYKEVSVREHSKVIVEKIEVSARSSCVSMSGHTDYSAVDLGPVNLDEDYMSIDNYFYECPDAYEKEEMQEHEFNCYAGLSLYYVPVEHVDAFEFIKTLIQDAENEVVDMNLLTTSQLLKLNEALQLLEKYNHASQ